MKTILIVDCCIRKDASRTRKILHAFLSGLSGYAVETVDLCAMPLRPLCGSFFEERQLLLQKRALSHPRFQLAHQFAKADRIVMAAPFYDLSFPALLKIYIENISVDGITFQTDTHGLSGLCQAKELIFITTRGGIYHDHEDEQATPYLKALCRFFNIPQFCMFDADGMDIIGYDHESALHKASCQAFAYAQKLAHEEDIQVQHTK